MKPTRRRFGPLFYLTLAVALILVVSVPGWPMMIEQWQAWGYARQLRDATPGERDIAIAGLTGLGPAARSWVIRATRDPDPKVRQAAISMVLRLDPDHPTPALDALIVVFRDADPTVRQAAVDQIYLTGGGFATQAGPAAIDRVIDGLRAALDDPVRDVRTGVALALGSLGKVASRAVPDLERIMARHPDITTRVFAAQALQSLQPIGSPARLAVVAALRRMLAEPALIQAREGPRVFGLLQREVGDEETAAVLVPLLNQPVRQNAFWYLTMLPPETSGVREALAGALANDDAMIRGDAALRFLQNQPALASPAFDVLLDQLIFRRDGGLGPEDIVGRLRQHAPDQVEPMVTRLIENLGRPDQIERRANIIETLGIIGPPEALPAVPALRAIAIKADRPPELAAIAALVKIDPPSAGEFLPSLIASLPPGREIDTRLDALRTLGALGPLARDAIPALLPLIDEEDFRISAGALGTITRIDPDRGAGLKQKIIDGR